MDKTSFSSGIPAIFVIDRSLQLLFLSFPPSAFLQFVLRASCPCDINSIGLATSIRAPQHSSIRSSTIDLQAKHPNIQSPKHLALIQASKQNTTHNGFPKVHKPPLLPYPDQPSLAKTNLVSPAAAPASSSPWHQQQAPSPCSPGARRRASSATCSREICTLGRRGLVSLLCLEVPGGL